MKMWNWAQKIFQPFFCFFSTGTVCVCVWFCFFIRLRAHKENIMMESTHTTEDGRKKNQKLNPDRKKRTISFSTKLMTQHKNGWFFSFFPLLTDGRAKEKCSSGYVNSFKMNFNREPLSFFFFLFIFFSSSVCIYNY